MKRLIRKASDEITPETMQIISQNVVNALQAAGYNPIKIYPKNDKEFDIYTGEYQQNNQVYFNLKPYDPVTVVLSYKVPSGGQFGFNSYRVPLGGYIPVQKALNNDFNLSGFPKPEAIPLAPQKPGTYYG